jgi:hypothetical protein
MRLWTVHPKHLDARGLVALWREALLAQAVLRGQTRGYRHHPQLVRFRAAPDPLAAITAYLHAVADETAARGYRFDRRRIHAPATALTMEETQGQLDHEWAHLLRKLQVRDPPRHRALRALDTAEPHPCFRIVPGRVRDWEKP